jgi:Dolichyl-phosphate-mannose-protein mannosyltransferase
MFSSNIKKIDWFLLTILLLGAMVRVWGINFCLPYKECRPDETAIVSYALKFFAGDPNPHFFSYPTLYLYALFGLYLLYFSLGKSFGNHTSTTDLFHEFAVNPTHLYLVGRGISVFLGTATILIVYKLAEGMFGRRVAVVSSLFLSLSHLHTRESHFGVTDTTFTFFVVLSIFFIIKTYRERTINLYLVSGIFVGIATSIKYPGVLLVFPLCVAHILCVLDKHVKNGNQIKKIQMEEVWFTRFIQYFLTALGVIFIIAGIVASPDLAARYLTSDGQFRNPPAYQAIRISVTALGFCLVVLSILLTKIRFLSDLLDKRLFGFTSTLIIAFLVGTPFALLDFQHFGVEFFSTYDSVNGIGGPDLGAGWLYHLRFTLPLGLGWAVCYAALVGILILIKLDLRQAAIFLAFPLIYYFVFGKSYTVMLRYMMPLIPFICILAAIGVLSVSNKLIDFVQLHSLKELVPLALATLILLPSAHAVTQSDRLLATKDNRLVAGDWVEQNTPENSSVYQTGSVYGHLELDKSPVFLARKLKELGEAPLSSTQLDYSKIIPIKAYHQWEYDDRSKQFTFNGQNQSELPQYIIRQESPLVWFSPVASEITDILAKSYTLKASFEAIKMGNGKNWFNQQDAFYLPFAGFKQVQRPGPNFYIYQRK